MKKPLLAAAITTILLAGCGDNTQSKNDNTKVEQKTETKSNDPMDKITASNEYKDFLKTFVDLYEVSYKKSRTNEGGFLGVVIPKPEIIEYAEYNKYQLQEVSKEAQEKIAHITKTAEYAFDTDMYNKIQSINEPEVYMTYEEKTYGNKNHFNDITVLQVTDVAPASEAQAKRSVKQKEFDKMQDEINKKIKERDEAGKKLQKLMAETLKDDKIQYVDIKDDYEYAPIKADMESPNQDKVQELQDKILKDTEKDLKAIQDKVAKESFVPYK